MAVDKKYGADVDAILARQHDNGADLWATPDGRLMVGAPFSTLESGIFLYELGMEPDDPVLQGVAELFFAAWREDGRFKVYPKGSVFPCQTAPVANFLCELGYAEDPRLQKTLEHLLETRYSDGGWRCNKFYFGRGPETEHSNPLPTLNALAAFRFTDVPQSGELDTAVDFLLGHWQTKAPIGPCHYGIGSLFMQVEWPRRGYNLFYYVYILSFYERAREDARFMEAFAALQERTQDGQVVIQRVSSPKLKKFGFCKVGEVSELATRQYQTILHNLGREA